MAIVIRSHTAVASVAPLDTWVGLKFDTKSKALQKIKGMPHRLFDFAKNQEEFLISDTFPFDKKIEYEVRHLDKGSVNWPLQVTELKNQWDAYKGKLREELDSTRQHVRQNLQIIRKKMKLAKAIGPAANKQLKALERAWQKNKKCLRTYPARQRQRQETWLKNNYEEARKKINRFFSESDAIYNNTAPLNL